ncbi:MAG: DUF2846 domain-containing protein [Terracidiphilus sp.]|jgi:hypothetical protein
MHNSAIGGSAGNCRGMLAFHSFAAILFACCMLALLASPSLAAAQDSKPAAAAPAPPTAPSAGKALVCIYRLSKAVGSAAHDSLFVNGVFLATLLNGEYDCVETPPGTVVVSGTSKMYYGPSVIMSSAAAITDAQKKENERIRFEAEAGKTYYMRWTSGMFASGIKVTPVDDATGAKEMSKLHVSKPPEAKPDEKQEAK